MTTAVIYLDPLAIHPVINGEWHRARLAEIPQPGDTITMICGISATAAFQPVGQRRRRQIPRQCPRCDDICRREQGIPSQQDRIGP
ncbi:hypothetical protein GCM10027258_39670 [Amycolatopsis stemonae]